MLPPSLRASASPSAFDIHTPAASQFPQPHTQRILRITMMLVTKCRPVNRNQPRRLLLAQIMGLLRPLRQLATHARLQSFFATIS